MTVIRYSHRSVGLEVPTYCPGKLILDGDSDTMTPRPVNGSDNGIAARLSVISMVPVEAPAAVGANVTLIEQLAPVEMLPMQLLLSVKSETLCHRSRCSGRSGVTVDYC